MKAKSITKRVLSAVLCAVMLFSCWVFTAPSASAATAGSYNIVIYSNCSDDCSDSRKEKFEFIIDYKTNNGTGSSGTKYLDIGSSYTSTGDKSHSCSIPGFPTKITLHLNTKFNWGWGSVKAKITKVTVQGQDISFPSTECKSDTGDNSKSNDVPANKFPYAASITDIGGGTSSVDVPKTANGSTTTSAFTVGTVKDQYGVNWYQDASLSCETPDGISWASNKLTVTNNANQANDYSVTVKETCGGASNTKTVSIKTFDYKVTFYDEDGKKVLKAEQTVDYGASATAPSNPTKAADNQRKYTFDKWTGDGYTTIKTGAQTKNVIASYKNGTDWDYTIKYYNGDDGVLDTDTIHYDQTLSVPTNASKQSTPEYDFEFKGWKEGTSSTYNEAGTDTCVTLSDSMTPADLSLNKDNRAKNYAAYFKATKRKYDITFSYRDANNNTQTIVRNNVTYGVTPSVPAAVATVTDAENQIPNKIVTASTTFTFTGWDTEVSSVTGTKTYTAQYASAPTPYDITFKWVNPENPTGDLLSDTKSVGYNSQPEAPTVPNYDTKLATYSFTGWSSEVVKVTGNATYTALYENPEYHQYSIVFQNEDGTTLSSTNYRWNVAVTAQADPSKAATAQYTYTFAGWIVDGDESNVVAGSAIDGKTIAQLATEGHDTHTYKAKFTATVNQYTITYKDEDGNVIKTVSGQDYGTVPADLTGANAAPALSEKDPDDTNHYTAYWYNESEKTLNDAITGDTVFSNLYKATAHTLDAGKVTKKATCSEKGIREKTCSVCAHKVLEPIAEDATNHDLKPIKANPKDGMTTGDAFVCMQCSWCEKFWAAEYVNGKYTANTVIENPDGSQEAITGADNAAGVKSSSDKVPSPFFNDYQDGELGYYYRDRGCSLKLMKDAYVDTNTRQDFRFSGSVQIPAGIDYRVNPTKDAAEVDNVILDFGFVYTQDSYGEGYGADKLTLANVAKDNHYAKMSVVDNNAGSAFDGSNWSGVTYHKNGDIETLTFNLVISMKAKNWKKQYAARPYITYKYHGVEYTVYDTGASDQSGGDYQYSYGSIYAIAAETIMYGVDPVVKNYVINRFINHRSDFGEDDAQGIDWWRYYFATTWAEFEQSAYGTDYKNALES